MPMTPDEKEPVAISPADLAARLNISERALRSKAREFGTYRILGRTMWFEKVDVIALMALLSGKNVEINRQIQRELAAERARQIMSNAPRRVHGQGFIYYIAAEDRVKIGFAKSVKQRFAALQTSSAVPLVLLASHRGSQKKERELHRQFAEYRLTGEWFRFEGALKEHITGLWGT